VVLSLAAAAIGAWAGDIFYDNLLVSPGYAPTTWQQEVAICAGALGAALIVIVVYALAKRRRGAISLALLAVFAFGIGGLAVWESNNVSPGATTANPPATILSVTTVTPVTTTLPPDQNNCETIAGAVADYDNSTSTYAAANFLDTFRGKLVNNTFYGNFVQGTNQNLMEYIGALEADASYNDLSEAETSAMQALGYCNSLYPSDGVIGNAYIQAQADGF
jgi:hypothetical protein